MQITNGAVQATITSCLLCPETSSCLDRSSKAQRIESALIEEASWKQKKATQNASLTQCKILARWLAVVGKSRDCSLEVKMNFIYLG